MNEEFDNELSEEYTFCLECHGPCLHGDPYCRKCHSEHLRGNYWCRHCKAYHDYYVHDTAPDWDGRHDVEVYTDEELRERFPEYYPTEKLKTNFA